MAKKKIKTIDETVFFLVGDDKEKVRNRLIENVYDVLKKKGNVLYVLPNGEYDASKKKHSMLENVVAEEIYDKLGALNNGIPISEQVAEEHYCYDDTPELFDGSLEENGVLNVIVNKREDMTMMRSLMMRLYCITNYECVAIEDIEGLLIEGGFPSEMELEWIMSALGALGMLANKRFYFSMNKETYEKLNEITHGNFESNIPTEFVE